MGSAPEENQKRSCTSLKGADLPRSAVAQRIVSVDEIAFCPDSGCSATITPLVHREGGMLCYYYLPARGRVSFRLLPTCTDVGEGFFVSMSSVATAIVPGTGVPENDTK